MACNSASSFHDDERSSCLNLVVNKSLIYSRERTLIYRLRVNMNRILLIDHEGHKENSA